MRPPEKKIQAREGTWRALHSGSDRWQPSAHPRSSSVQTATDSAPHPLVSRTHSAAPVVILGATNDAARRKLPSSLPLPLPSACGIPPDGAVPPPLEPEPELPSTAFAGRSFVLRGKADDANVRGAIEGAGVGSCVGRMTGRILLSYGSLAAASSTILQSDQDLASNFGNHVPIKGFVHEVLRRSRASGSVLQTALCYLEAIRPKVPELIQKEQFGKGTRGELDTDLPVKPATAAELEMEAQWAELSATTNFDFEAGNRNDEDAMDAVRVTDEDMACTATLSTTPSQRPPTRR